METDAGCVSVIREDRFHWSLRIKRLTDSEFINEPKKANQHDAGFDLQADIEDSVYLLPQQRVVIPTGYAWAIPDGWVGQVCPRSGIAAKHGVTVGNAPGIIDAGYRGEVKVILQNNSSKTFEINPGERIGQMVIVPVMMSVPVLVESLEDTDRGEGGFGSSGK